MCTRTHGHIHTNGVGRARPRSRSGSRQTWPQIFARASLALCNAHTHAQVHRSLRALDPCSPCTGQSPAGWLRRSLSAAHRKACRICAVGPREYTPVHTYAHTHGRISTGLHGWPDDGRGSPIWTFWFSRLARTFPGHVGFLLTRTLGVVLSDMDCRTQSRFARMLRVPSMTCLLLRGFCRRAGTAFSAGRTVRTHPRFYGRRGGLFAGRPDMSTFPADAKRSPSPVLLARRSVRCVVVAVFFSADPAPTVVLWAARGAGMDGTRVLRHVLRSILARRGSG